LFPELITPNNDGNNDYLYFNLAEYNSNLTVEVFNRWGKTVYKNNDYKNEFNGISLNGEELPEDTYFVILADTEKKIYSGYFLLKRK
jgi:gliding motility-associated-like protein